MGMRSTAETRPTRSDGGVVLAGVFLVLILLTGIIAFASFPVGIYTVFWTPLSSNTTASTTGQPILWIGPAAVLLPFDVTYGAAFFAVSLVYFAMLAGSLRQGKSVPDALKDGVGVGFSGFFSNRFLVVLISIGFLIFTAAMVDVVVNLAGGTIGNPLSSGDPLKTLVQLTLAPLREEFGFRVLTIGLVALAFSLRRPLTAALRTLWRPSAAFEGVAVGSATSAVIWVATGISAVVFGACHVGVVCGGGGWDLGKLPEATYGGVVLGFLYVKYGFHVAVLAHWGVDYLGSVFAFFGQGAYGIGWTSTPGFILQGVVALDLVLAFGVACFLVVAYLGLSWALHRNGPAEAPSLAANPPAQPLGGGPS